MKYLSGILAIYILVLTAIPCVDGPEDVTSTKVEISQSSSTSHQHDIDHCSPFCTCNCCVTPVTINSAVIKFRIAEIGQFNYPAYHSGFYLSPSGSIWQPPQNNLKIC